MTKSVHKCRLIDILSAILVIATRQNPYSILREFDESNLYTKFGKNQMIND